MMLKNLSLFINKEQAAQQLLTKLKGYENRKCSIVAISNGAVPIANYIAKHLRADLTFMPVEVLKDPADPLKSIGRVSFDFVITDDVSRDIPQDYIYHQGQRLRSELISKYPDVYKAMERMFKDRFVILVGDATKSSRKIIACLRSVQRQQPKKVVVLVPAITPEAAREVMQEIDELFFNQIASEDLINDCYPELNTVANKEDLSFAGINAVRIFQKNRENEN